VWIGAIAYPPRLQGNGHCKAGQGGLDGTVGGVLSSVQESLGLSCMHVLSDGCRSLFWPQARPSGPFTQDRPDAALISILSPCFGNLSSPTRVDIVDASRLESMVDENTHVVRRSPRGSRDGMVRDIVIAFSLNGGFKYRGPHLAVIPYLESRLRLTLPIWDREFSREGDSGAWVFGEGDSGWIGMVIGGSDYPLTQSYVLPGCLLVDWFSDGVAQGPLRASFTP
jgi:hypothetical protein